MEVWLSNMKKKARVIAVVFLCILAVLTFVSRTVYNKSLPQVTAVKVETGSVLLTIETVASLHYSKETEVKAGNNWRIGDIMVENGDFVTTGDLLLTLDMYDMDMLIMSQELEILRLENAVANHVESVSAAESAEIKAPFDGALLMSDTVKAGSRLDKSAVIGRYVDSSSFKAEFPFISVYRDKIVTGMAAEVSLPEWTSVTTGRVSRISSEDRVLEGSLVFNVEVTIGNPGVLTEDSFISASISAEDGELMLAAAPGVLRYAQEESLTAPISGVILDTALSSGSRFLMGETVLRMRGEQGERDARWRRSFDELTAQLDLAQKRMERMIYPPEGKIFAETDGVVSCLSAKPGDYLREGDILLTLLPDEIPELLFTLPAKDGEPFGNLAFIRALLGVIRQDDEHNNAFERIDVSGIIISSVMKEGLWECRAVMQTFEGRPVIGQEIPVRAELHGTRQDNVVPLSVVFEKSGQAVVYSIEERKGLFGKENFLSEIVVEVLYDNGKLVSLSGTGLHAGMLLASDPSHYISAGDAVWVRE